MASSKKRLNILNSQKVFNFQIRSPLIRTQVNINNYQDYEQYIQEFINEQDEFITDRDEVEYSLVYNQLMPYEFILSMIEYGGKVEVVTNESLPISLIDRMARFPRNCYITYLFKDEYTQKEIENIQQASAGLKISILLQADDSTDAYQVLTSLADIPFIIDQVIIQYNGTDYGIEYELFNDIRDALSGWKMAIIFETNNKKQKEYMLKRKEVDENIRKSSTVWIKK